MSLLLFSEYPTPCAVPWRTGGITSWDTSRSQGCVGVPILLRSLIYFSIREQVICKSSCSFALAQWGEAARDHAVCMSLGWNHVSFFKKKEKKKTFLEIQCFSPNLLHLKLSTFFPPLNVQAWKLKSKADPFLELPSIFAFYGFHSAKNTAII